MRPRHRIEQDFNSSIDKGNTPLTNDLKEILEVLLDIRELLKK